MEMSNKTNEKIMENVREMDEEKDIIVEPILPEEYEDPAEELAEQNFRDTRDREREDEEDSRLR